MKDAAGAETGESRTVGGAERKVVLLVNGLHAKSGGGVTYLANVLPLIAAESDFEVHLCLHREQQDLPLGGGDDVRRHVFDFPTGFWRLLVREQIEVPRLAQKIGADVVFSPANYGPLRARHSVVLLRNALDVAGVERRPLKIAYWALLALASGIITAIPITAPTAHASKQLRIALRNRVTLASPRRITTHDITGL